MMSLDFWLAVGVLALVPLWMAAYGGHVAADSINDVQRRASVKFKFWAIGALGLAIAFVNQHRVANSDEKRQRELGSWQHKVTEQLDDIRTNPKYSTEQKRDAGKLQRQVDRGPQLSNPGPYKTLSARTPPRLHPDSPDPFPEFDNAHLAAWGNELADRILNDFKDYWNNTYPHQMGNPENVQANRLKLYNKFTECCADRARAYRKEVIGRLGADPIPDSIANVYLDSLKDLKDDPMSLQPRGIEQIAINIRALAVAIGKKPD